MAFNITTYDEKEASQWDDFVLNISMNGTFLQTRKFINYHNPTKFNDNSLMILKGDTIAAVILACKIYKDKEVLFYSHPGTSYGGLIISPQYYNTTCINEIMDRLEAYLLEHNFTSCIMRETPAIFSRSGTELIDYFFYNKGYMQYNELNFYLFLEKFQTDIVTQFSSSKRRDYRYSLKNNLLFKQLNRLEEIQGFYNVLRLNQKKLNLRSVHSLEELIDIKFNRFPNNVEFYGVYKNDAIIAGAMVFLFHNKIFHTQYLASDERYLNTYPMDFLIYNLIDTAVSKQLEIFTLGISTENNGKYLNSGLARFKEGFGTDYCLNKTFEKSL